MPATAAGEAVLVIYTSVRVLSFRLLSAIRRCNPSQALKICRESVVTLFPYSLVCVYPFIVVIPLENKLEVGVKMVDGGGGTEDANLIL